MWREDEHQVAFFLEYDTGSEVHAVLRSKLAANRKVVAGGGPVWPVLYWLPSTARERRFRR